MAPSAFDHKISIPFRKLRKLECEEKITYTLQVHIGTWVRLEEFKNEQIEPLFAQHQIYAALAYITVMQINKLPLSLVS